MADISAIFFILLIISVAFPAMLTAWWLLFPALITRAQTRIEKSLARSFWLGLVIIIALTIPIVILLALPFGPAKFIGWILIAASLALSSIGSAGIAAHLGERMQQAGIATLHWELSSAVPWCLNSPHSSRCWVGSSSCRLPSLLPLAPRALPYSTGFPARNRKLLL